jgi:hypothetical protein
MIPLEVSDEVAEQYARNIVKVYQSATKDQRERGRTWYHNANSLARFLDETNVRRSAGVIAALSANKRWADNIDLAVKAFTVGPQGHMPDALDKVRRILSGQDPATVLPAFRKTWWFFMCIMHPDDPRAVVVDRHAHDIAIGEKYGDRNRGLSTQKRYDIIADAYRRAGYLLGVQPMVVQATTWLVATDG